MARIISITLRNQRSFPDNDRWTMEVVRDDDYTSREEKELSEITEALNEIIEFAEKVKTQDQKIVEKLESENKKIIETLIKNTPKEELGNFLSMFGEWEINKEYVKGNYIVNNGKLYVVNIDHTSSEVLRPGLNVKYYTIADDKDRPLPWGQYADGIERNVNEDPYQVGDKVTWTDGNVYMYVAHNAIGDNNPESYSQGWQLVEGE